MSENTAGNTAQRGNTMAELSPQDLSDLRALGALARAGQDDKRDAAWIAQTDLAKAADARGARRMALAVVATMVGMVGASAAIVVVLIGQAPKRGVARGPEVAPPLAYTLGRPAESAAARYLFADGTTVAPVADAAVAIDASAAARPRVRIVGGRVRVRVVHQDGRQWTFHAGPYDVRVTGTAFDLSWDDGAGRVALHMREGTVIVSGPGLAAPAPVRAGQDLSASLAGGAPVITAVAPEPELRPSEDERPVRGREPASGSGRGESWRVLVGRGELAAVLAQARQRPLAACLSRCSSEELRALGDAARYSRQPALATRALAALRRRFPATADGTAATFLLGRTAEAQGRWKDAAGWYARYLDEAPTGELAVEAAAGRERAAGKVAGADGAPSARVRSAH